jgi:Hsp70 protein
MTVLALEVGTSGVRAAVARDGRTQVLRLGDEQDAMPGAVLLDENGSLVLGARALSLGVHLPGRLLTDLPGLLEDGRTILGNRVVDVEDILPAVVSHVHEQCVADIGTSEWQLRLVIPGSWGPACERRIAQALTKTGVDNSVVAAPVALAHRLVDLPEPRTMLALADFGAGGLECSVLVRGRSGYEIVSAPVVRRDLSGDLLDQRILAHVTSESDELAGAVEKLLSPTTAEGRNLALALYAEVRRVKERLGEAQAFELHLPGRDTPVQVTHAEFEACAEPVVKAVADALEEVIESAGCRSKDLGEVLLAGGSSRIPMVSSEIWRRLELSRPPVLVGHEDSGSAFDPGSQAVLGALRAEDYRPPQAGQRVQTRPEAATSTSAAARTKGGPTGIPTAASLGGRLAGIWSLLRESTPAKVISGASVVVVVVLLVLLLAVPGPGPKPKPKHDAARHTTTTTSPKVTGAELVSDDGLGTVVPTSIAPSCISLSTTTGLPSGATGAVECNSSDASGNVGVDYIKFSGDADLDLGFAHDLQSAGIQVGSGDCDDASSFPAECTWALSSTSTTPAGDVAYYDLPATTSEPASSFVEWTLADADTLAVAISTTVPDTDLRNWWSACGGEGGSAVAQTCSSGGD